MMFVGIAVILTCTNVSIVYSDEKGANVQAMEQADDNAVFNRVGDWFATIGKSKEEKEIIKAERKAQRMKKKAEKKMKENKGEIKKSGEEEMKKMKNMNKERKGSEKGAKKGS